jgi:hypothetical protein
MLKAGFSAMDVLFWAIAGYEGYRLTGRAVARVQARVTAEETPAAAPEQPVIHPSQFFGRPRASQ